MNWTPHTDKENLNLLWDLWRLACGSNEEAAKQAAKKLRDLILESQQEPDWGKMDRLLFYHYCDTHDLLPNIPDWPNP